MSDSHDRFVQVGTEQLPVIAVLGGTVGGEAHEPGGLIAPVELGGLGQLGELGRILIEDRAAHRNAPTGVEGHLRAIDFLQGDLHRVEGALVHSAFGRIGGVFHQLGFEIVRGAEEGVLLGFAAPGNVFCRFLGETALANQPERIPGGQGDLVQNKVRILQGKRGVEGIGREEGKDLHGIFRCPRGAGQRPHPRMEKGSAPASVFRSVQDHGILRRPVPGGEGDAGERQRRASTVGGVEDDLHRHAGSADEMGLFIVVQPIVDISPAVKIRSFLAVLPMDSRRQGKGQAQGQEQG